MNLQQRSPRAAVSVVTLPRSDDQELAGEYHRLLLTAIEDLDNTEFCRTGRRSARARELRSQVALLERAGVGGS